MMRDITEIKSISAERTERVNPEKQIENSLNFDNDSGSDEWQNAIELSDDSEEWQDSIELTNDLSVTDERSLEKAPNKLSRFEESKQVKRMTDCLNGLQELKRENWINLSFSERVNVMQKIENQSAKIGCRPALTIETEAMKKNSLGYTDWKTKKIVINENLLYSNNLEDFQQSIKTLIHEGRHAYQYSNIFDERTEPNEEKYRSWLINIATGYCAAKLFGLKRYYLQPLEVDARVFSESIISKMKI